MSDAENGIRAALDAHVNGLAGKARWLDDLRGDFAIEVDREAAHALIKALRDDQALGCALLVFITAADNYLDEPRFVVTYRVRSLTNNFDVRLNVLVGGEEPEVDSITDLYPAANWLEREVWDMFGVRFKGHPNLERILMWEGFDAHPLRKEYPLLGNTPGTPGYAGKGGKL